MKSHIRSFLTRVCGKINKSTKRFSSKSCSFPSVLLFVYITWHKAVYHAKKFVLFKIILEEHRIFHKTPAQSLLRIIHVLQGSPFTLSHYFDFFFCFLTGCKKKFIVHAYSIFNQHTFAVTTRNWTFCFTLN